MEPKEFNEIMLSIAVSHKEWIAHLKNKSGYWPEVYSEKKGENELYLSTLVRIMRYDRWWAIHCVESTCISGAEGQYEAFKRLASSVHNIQHLYIVDRNILKDTGTYVDDLDVLQEEEEIRLKKLLRL